MYSSGTAVDTSNTHILIGPHLWVHYYWEFLLLELILWVSLAEILNWWHHRQIGVSNTSMGLGRSNIAPHTDSSKININFCSFGNASTLFLLLSLYYFRTIEKTASSIVSNDSNITKYQNSQLISPVPNVSDGFSYTVSMALHTCKYSAMIL